MKPQSSVRTSRSQDEHGAVFPFLAVCIFALVVIMGFVLDLSRMEATIRQAQSAVDAAAIAGATLLETDALANVQEEVDDWAKVKRAVLLTLSTSGVRGLDSEASTSLCIDEDACTPAFRFDDAASSASSYDCPDYDRVTGTRGNLGVTVSRLLYCYWRAPWENPATAVISRQIFSLENNPTHFCKANAVGVELSLSGLGTSFSRLMGIHEMSTIRVNATAYMNQAVPPIGSMCESVNCDAIGIRDLLEERGLIPSPEPTPWPGTAAASITTEPCPYPSPLPAPVCP